MYGTWHGTNLFSMVGLLNMKKFFKDFMKFEWPVKCIFVGTFIVIVGYVLGDGSASAAEKWDPVVYIGAGIAILGWGSIATSGWW